MRQFFQAFACLWPIIWFLFPHLTCSSTLPNIGAKLFSKMDSGPEAYGRRGLGITYYGVASPSFLIPKGPFCACAAPPLSHGWEICDFLIVFSEFGSSLSLR